MRISIGRLAGIATLTLGMTIGISPRAHASLTQANDTLTGQLVVQGSATANGQPVANGTVILYAWPKNSVLSALQPGNDVPLQVVGTSTTGPSGQFSVAVSSPAALTSSAMPDGTVNLEVDVLTATGEADYSFSRTLIQTASGPVLALPPPDGGTSAAAPEQADLQLTSVAEGQLVPDHCAVQLIKHFAPSPTVIGATYDITDAVTQTFIYGRDQSSSLGVSHSPSGAADTFSEAGTASFDSSSSTTFPSSTGPVSTQYKTYFTHSLFGKFCSGSNGYLLYLTRPTEWDGGAVTASTGPPKAIYCVYYQQGSTFTKTDTAAFIFAGGLTIPGIGVTLSAQTGYSTTATVQYHFGLSHYLCGTNDYPGGDPKRMVAGKA